MLGKAWLPSIQNHNLAFALEKKATGGLYARLSDFDDFRLNVSAKRADAARWLLARLAASHRIVSLCA